MTASILSTPKKVEARLQFTSSATAHHRSLVLDFSSKHSSGVLGS
jgi:hypothetical protein